MGQTEQQQPRWQIPFFSIWTGQQLSLIGSSVAQFALVWWLTDTIAPLFFVFIPQPPPRAVAAAAGGRGPRLWADVREGLGYIWHWRGLLAMMTVAAVVNFFLWPAFSLTPILVTQHFGGGATQLGWMNSVGL